MLLVGIFVYVVHGNIKLENTYSQKYFVKNNKIHSFTCI